MAQPIRLVCLDLAGTTVTDSGAVNEAFSAAMDAAGIDPSSERFLQASQYVQATMGQSKIDVFRALFDGDADRADLANRSFEAAYGLSIEGGRVAAMPGAEAAMDELVAHGAQVCLTTGFAPETRDALLGALGWAGRAALVLSPADAGRGRPFPDMILTAVLRLGIDDVAAVAVVGDTTNDLLSGQRAGVGTVVGVLTGAHDKNQLATVVGAQIIDSVADLPALLFDPHRT
jgi:phosphoglycolate phosphatase